MPDTILSLADLQPGDLFGNPPGVWYTKEICRLQGSQTFHWGLWISPPDRVITESIGKGTAITRYDYAQSYIYRIKALQNVSVQDILNAIADYGRSTYGMSENLSTVYRYLLDYWLPQYPWEGPPVPSFLPGWPSSWATPTDYSFSKPFNTPVNCIEYVTLIAERLGYEILPPGEIVVEKNLENSPLLDYLGILQIPQGTPSY